MPRPTATYWTNNNPPALNAPNLNGREGAILDYSEELAVPLVVDLGDIVFNPSLDCQGRLQTVATARLINNATLTISNLPAGGNATVSAKQDATGGFTLGFAPNVRWDAGTPPTITPTANAKDVYGFFNDGVDLIGFVVAQNIS